MIALTINDFIMFSEFDAVISRFVLKEKDYLVDYPSCDLELVVFELPKFQQMLEQIDTLTEKWMYFLQHNLSGPIAGSGLLAEATVASDRKPAPPTRR